MRIACLLFIVSLSAVMAYGQQDSDKVFKHSKGTWDYPVENGSLIPGNKFTEIRNEFKSCIFHMDSTSAIHAIFEGLVTSVASDDPADEYVMVTRFGNYFILYSGIKQPLFKKGNYIKAGQKIGFPSKDLDGISRIEIVLFNHKGVLDISSWFKHYHHLTK